MISLNNFHNMESSIEITSGHSVVSPRQLLDYSFECKSLARVTRKITPKIYFADFCDFTVNTTRRKSLPFAIPVDWESMGKFGGEDVLQ